MSKPIDIDDVKRKLESGQSMEEVSRYHGITKQGMTKRLRTSYVNCQKCPKLQEYEDFMFRLGLKSPKHRRRDPEQVYEDYLRSGSIYAVAREYGITHQAVSHFLNKHGYKPRQPITDHERANIVNDYISSKKPAAEIARKFGRSPHTVSRILKSHGVEVKRGRPYNRPSVLRKHAPHYEVAQMYNEGLSLSQIAKHYNTSPNTIMRRLEDMKIPRRPVGSWTKA